MTCTLILGGARSGKSMHAEQLAGACGKEVIYIATAQAGDGEMAERISLHQERRNSNWKTIEEPVALGAAILQWSTPQRVLLVDCLTIWLSNLLFFEVREYPEVGAITPPKIFNEQRSQLLNAIEHAKGDVILVANEVGLGIIPQGAISRWYVDEAGRLNQAVAAKCQQVFFVAAGLPLKLKGA